MLLLMCYPALTSTTEVCRGSYTQSFIGKSSVQTRRRYVQLLARPITAVPRRSLCASVRYLSKAASSILYSASLGGSAMLAQHTRSTGLLCGRPVALELSTRQLERSESWQGQLQTFAEDASIFTVLIEAFNVLEMFRTIRSTNLLTYLLTYLWLQTAVQSL